VPASRTRAGAKRHDLLESVAVDDASTLRAEWRAEEEAWSRAALEHWEHGRGLDDVLRDCRHRGDRVTVAFGGVTWSGAVVAVGSDVVRIAAGDVTVDVRLAADAPFLLRVHPSADDDRRSHGDGTLTSFRARLRELDGTTVCIGTAAGSLEGGVRIGRDQLRLTDGAGGVTYVPIGSAWWVHPLADD
jgi:hypothetical protein